MNTTKRVCKQCGSDKHMRRIIMGAPCERWRVCYKCEETLLEEYHDENTESDDAYPSIDNDDDIEI